MIGQMDSLHREITCLKDELIEQKKKEETARNNLKMELKKVKKELQTARMVETKRKRTALYLVESFQKERKKVKVDVPESLPTFCEICGERGLVVTIKRECELTGDWAVCTNCRMTCPDCLKEYASIDAYMHCLCGM